MILEFVVFSLVAVSPSLNSVVKNFRSECRSEEFACSDGTCISVGLLCDGQTNCLEGEDEAMCDTGMGISKIGNDGGGLHRWRRQTSRCKNSQFRCRTGDCVPSDGKCDGIKDCPDGSDEAHALCRNLECPDHLFRCTYGACVDGYGKCDNITNCVDNSDELHPDCFAVPNSLPIPPPKEFTCDDGRQIPRTETCDGRADCADGSDETVRQCAANRCQSIHFQCAYGACVDSGSNCDGKVDCADGSDEAVDLCDDRIGTGTGATSRPTGTLPPPPVGTGNCVLPPFPDHGHYIVEGQPQVRPGQRLEAASLSITCDTGYKPTDDIKPFCFGNNGWSAAVPKCIQFCRLNQQRSVKYSCIVEGTQGGTRECPQYVPSGTRVIPACNTPNYYSRYPLRYMTCTNGEFDVIEICEPGLSKEGTHITILIKDKVEIYIGKFNYTDVVGGNGADQVGVIGQNGVGSHSGANHLAASGQIGVESHSGANHLGASGQIGVGSHSGANHLGPSGQIGIGSHSWAGQVGAVRPLESGGPMGREPVSQNDCNNEYADRIVFSDERENNRALFHRENKNHFTVRDDKFVIHVGQLSNDKRDKSNKPASNYDVEEDDWRMGRRDRFRSRFGGAENTYLDSNEITANPTRPYTDSFDIRK